MSQIFQKINFSLLSCTSIWTINYKILVKVDLFCFNKVSMKKKFKNRLDNGAIAKLASITSTAITTFQEKQMSFQPDMILEYAHFLGDFYKKKGFANPSVFADSYVTLNKRISTRFIEKDFDLLSTKDSFLKKKWIIPIKDEIKGF